MITQGLRNKITVSLAEPLAIVANELFQSAQQSDSFQDSLDKLILASLSGISTLAGAAGRLLTFIDGKPELAAGGVVGYLFGGKLGFLAGAAVASSFEYVKNTFDYYKSLFDNSLSQAEKAGIALDKLKSQIALLETPGIGSLVANKDSVLESLKKQRAEVEFMLVDMGEYERIGGSAMETVTGFASNLGSALGEISDATRLAAEQYGTFQRDVVEAPISIDPDFSNQSNGTETLVEQAPTGEIAAMIGEYQNYQDLRVAANEDANTTILTSTRSYFAQQLASAAQFNKTWTEFNAAGTKDRFKIFSGETAGALATLSQYSRKWFEINKAMGVANALVNIAEGVTAALALPPPASFFVAAQTALIGVAQLTQIKNTKFGSNANVVQPGGGSVNFPSANASNDTAVIDTESGPATAPVTVHVYPSLGASQVEIDRQIAQSIRRSVESDEIIPETTIIFNSAA